MTFEQALEPVMVLPGKAATEIRLKACEILKRYFAGDATLVPELVANAASDAPVNQMARAAMAADVAAVDAPRAITMEVPNGVVLAAVTEQLAPAIAAASDTASVALNAQAKATHYEHMSYQMRGQLGASAAVAGSYTRTENKRLKTDLDAALGREGSLMQQNAKLVDMLALRDVQTTKLVERLLLQL